MPSAGRAPGAPSCSGCSGDILGPLGEEGSLGQHHRQVLVGLWGYCEETLSSGEREGALQCLPASSHGSTASGQGQGDEGATQGQIHGPHRLQPARRGQASGALEPTGQGLPPVDTTGEAKPRDPTKAGVPCIPSSKRASISVPGVVPGTCFSFN